MEVDDGPFLYKQLFHFDCFRECNHWHVIRPSILHVILIAPSEKPPHDTIVRIFSKQDAPRCQELSIEVLLEDPDLGTAGPEPTVPS